MTSIWFIGVDSGVGTKEGGKEPEKRVGNATPWASVDFDAELGVI